MMHEDAGQSEKHMIRRLRKEPLETGNSLVLSSMLEHQTGAEVV